MFGSVEAAAHSGFLSGWGGMYLTTTWAVMAILTIMAILATRSMKWLPSGFQNVMEFLIEALYDFLEGSLGPERTRKYFPLLMTFFLFILISNYVGLLPWVGHAGPDKGGINAFIPPTANISVTAALAISVFFATHILGMGAHGIKYFKHFVTPYALMLPLNIIEELVRPLSLSMRLYGNIYGHELVAGALLSMAPWFFPVPIQLLGLLTGAIQAFVFTLLATNYIAGATEKHH